MTRQDWIDKGADEDALFLTESMYDEAIVGVSTDGRIVYDYDKVITILMETDGMTEEDALEYADFNIVGAYVGPLTPLFIYT